MHNLQCLITPTDEQLARSSLKRFRKQSKLVDNPPRKKTKILHEIKSNHEIVFPAGQWQSPRKNHNLHRPRKPRNIMKPKNNPVTDPINPCLVSCRKYASGIARSQNQLELIRKYVRRDNPMRETMLTVLKDHIEDCAYILRFNNARLNYVFQPQF